MCLVMIIVVIVQSAFGLQFCFSFFCEKGGKEVGVHE
jgi:hypothetical protein